MLPDPDPVMLQWYLSILSVLRLIVDHIEWAVFMLEVLFSVWQIHKSTSGKKYNYQFSRFNVFITNYAVSLMLPAESAINMWCLKLACFDLENIVAAVLSHIFRHFSTMILELRDMILTLEMM